MPTKPSLVELDQEWREATTYAKSICVSLAKKFPTVPNWEPFDDLMDILTQIDNMIVAVPQGFGVLHLDTNDKKDCT